MKKLITIIPVSIICLTLISNDKLPLEYNGRMTQPVSFFYAQADTIIINPYLNIFKFDLEILPPSAGIQLYKDGIIFSSSSKSDADMISGNFSFGNRMLFYATLEDSVPGSKAALPVNVMLDVPAEGISFSSETGKMYYSRVSDQDGKVKIYSAEPLSGGIIRPGKIMDLALSFCDDDNYTHPAIASEGDLMIFSSDMPGGYGGLDLYISRFSNEQWSDPENMGNNINSEGTELYACLDRENNLYFSSDGHPGYGGYDIFYSNFNGSEWEKPLNLSDQINTGDDEISFKIDPVTGNFGFFTVAKHSGLFKKQTARHLYKVELNGEYITDSLVFLSDVLKYYAEEKLAAEKLLAEKLVTEIEAKKREAEKLAADRLMAIMAAEDRKDKMSLADSLKAAEALTEELTAEKLAEGKEADSLKAAELAAEKLAAEKQAAELAAKELEARLAREKRIADSLRAQELKDRQEDAIKDNVVYRVQFLSRTKPGNRKKISVGSTEYQIYEYFYKAAWRETAGEFNILSDAVELRNRMRNAGYKEAFVVAFKNNERSLDPDLFR